MGSEMFDWQLLNVPVDEGKGISTAVVNSFS